MLLSSNGIKHKIQYLISPYIVDFYLPQRGIIIEIDGGIHKKKLSSDAKREMYLFSFGLIVVRHSNYANLKKVLKEIQMFDVLDKIHQRRFSEKISKINSLFSQRGYKNKPLDFDNMDTWIDVVTKSNKQLRKKHCTQNRVENYTKFAQIFTCDELTFYCDGIDHWCFYKRIKRMFRETACECEEIKC